MRLRLSVVQSHSGVPFPIAAVAAVLAATMGAVAPAPSSAQATAPAIHVGPNVQVSAARAHDTHYEVVVSAHPTDASRLIAGSLIYPDSGGTYETIAYASSDGGATWLPTLAGATLDHTGDPATAYGPDGVAYYVASSIPLAGERQLLLFRAEDGGRGWEGPFHLTYMDREYITVDASMGAWRGRVYVNGNNRVPRTISDFVIHRSTDGGRTFAGPGTRAAFGSVQATVTGNAVVASDGTVVGVYVEGPASPPDARESSIQSIWSADGGTTLAGSARIDRFVAGGERKGPVLGNANSEPVIAIDATGGQYQDRLYVAWPDRRAGQSEIMFSWSADKGRTWAATRVINDNPAGSVTDEFMPELAVNRDGIVGVSWYDRRDHPDNLGWDVRFAASADGGVTFGASVKVSERGASFPPGTSRAKPAASARPSAAETINAGRDSFRFMGGDTAGLAADASGAFHAMWVDNHTGVPQVWAATVSVQRAPRRD